MKETDLQKIDLNLLVMFDVLMQTRSATRAARVLHRTQSAISHSLEKLRQQLGDPLLVRRGMDMEPSPYAEHLYEQLRPLLRQLAQALGPSDPFDPGRSDRRFRLTMRDFLAGLFPDLIYLIRGQAPGLKVEWVQVPKDVFGELIEGQLDLYLGPSPMPTPFGIDSSTVGGLTWACYARAEHPAVRSWDAHQWARWPHVQVGTGDPARNPVTLAAAQQSLSRQIGVSVPIFSAVAPVLAHSDHLATLPQAVMRHQIHHWGLAELPTPFPVQAIGHAIYTASRMRGDPATQWFKRQVEHALAPFMEA